MKFSVYPKKVKKYSDIEFIAGIKNEDVQNDLAEVCFDYYTKYYKKVVHTDSWKMDIFQESFAELWLEIYEGDIYVSEDNRICHRIWKTEETRKLNCSLLTYFMSIAKNTYLAKALTKRDISMTDWKAMKIKETSYEESLRIDSNNAPTKNIKDEILDNCIDSMPKRCRQILTMFYWDALSLDEILEKIEDISTKDALKTKKSKCMVTLENRINIGLIEIGLKPYTKHKK